MEFFKMTTAEKRREEILAAAGKCFRKKGFHQTSMQELCAEAGLSPGSVYRYFPSKNAIIEALVEQEKDYFFELFRRLDRQTDTLTGMLAMMDAFTSPDVGQVHLDAETTAEAFRQEAVHETLRRYDAEVNDRLTALIREGQENGSIRRSADPRAAAILLACIADGLAYRRALGFLPDAATLNDAFSALARRMLCP